MTASAVASPFAKASAENEAMADKYAIQAYRILN
jgi:hypothetical protein